MWVSPPTEVTRSGRNACARFLWSGAKLFDLRGVKADHGVVLRNE